MPTVDEALGAPGGIAAALAAGEQTISQNQTVTFTKYSRAVLPLDGLVFWITTGQTNDVQCSIHTETVTSQDETETPGATNVVMTSTTELDDLLADSPTTKWIAVWNGLHFAFTRTRRFYVPADLYHYFGRALLPSESSQVIDTATSLDPTLLIASNSLPVFIFLNVYVAPYWNPYNNTADAIPDPPPPAIPPTPTPILPLPTLWPSYLVPANLPPPYATVHVESSENLQPVAWMDANSNPYSLTSDVVRITMFGLSNNQAMLLRDSIVQFCEDQRIIGLQEISPIREERAPQVDFGIIAQKKTLTLRVAYLESAVINFARLLFDKIVVDYEPQSPTEWPPRFNPYV